MSPDAKRKTDSKQPSPPPKRTIGPFELGDTLGVGGMGIVYRGVYTKTGQQMAVKVLTPEMSSNEGVLKRFSREIEILKKLRHDNIVRYYGGGKSGGQQFYVMELLTGGSLEDLLQKKGRLPWEAVIDYGVQICKALEHAHNAGIVHRDLKPANLFVTRDGKLKLGDFGIARDTQRTALTAAGKTVGTYAYMAPEQISGKPPVSRKTDLYALGCVMYEMLTGHPPFDGNTPAEILFKHLEEDPPDLRSEAIDCPVWLETVVMKLLEKDPEERYYDALAAQVAIQEVGEKVAKQASVSKQTAAGASAAKTVKDQTELRKILGKKKKKKKKQGPVWEQAWFLTACLLLLIAGVTWGLWPLSEEELYRRAAVMMETSDRVQWSDARRLYLEPLLEKYPEGEYADEAHAFIDKIDMDKAERQIETNEKRGREPKSEAERLYRDARDYETFGDRVTAVEKYRSMVALLDNSEEDRPIVNLARRQIAALESGGAADNDRATFVNNSLLRAEEFYKRGDVPSARKIWNSIVTLYEANLEFEPQVKYATARLDREDVELPEFLFPEDDQDPQLDPAAEPLEGDADEFSSAS